MKSASHHALWRSTPPLRRAHRALRPSQCGDSIDLACSNNTANPGQAAGFDLFLVTGDVIFIAVDSTIDTGGSFVLNIELL